MRRKHRLSVEDWARRAGVSRPTIQRAANPKYQFSTKANTIAAMAQALGEEVPSFVKMSSAQAFNEAGLAGVLAEIVRVLAPEAQPSEEMLLLSAEALIETLSALASDPDAAADPEKSRVVARALIRRLGQ